MTLAKIPALARTGVDIVSAGALTHSAPSVDLALDIAIVLGKRRINIEVDGDQHKDVRGRSRRHDIARDRVLRGLGWEILRFPAWRCLREPQQVVDEIAEGFL